MGLFKQMKDMKNTIHEAPGMVANARALGEQAQQMAAAQQAAAAQQVASMSAAVDEGEAIAGIDLATYARINREISKSGVDAAGIGVFVASQGIDPDAWAQATEGWNARFKGNMPLAARYGTLYSQG